MLCRMVLSPGLRPAERPPRSSQRRAPRARPVLLGPALTAALAALASATAAEAPPPGPPAALRVPGPLSPRNASYQIRARLDEKDHTVKGTALLSWRNLERGPADRLVFHLYYNAFKSDASAFIREAGRRLRGDRMPDGGFGAIDVTALKVNGQDLRARAQVDDTLLIVPLPQPLGPSAAAQVELAFTAKLPRVFARAGYEGDFHAITQWFPKIGVFDCDPPASATAAPPACRWRARQYHGFTEFFADYGVYDVELDAPASAVVGGTGVLVSEERRGDRRLWRFRAEDVHDFALMTDPRFLVVDDEVRDAWGQVRVRLLTRRGAEAMTARHLRATREGLLELERRYGVYPYSNITVVVPPTDAGGAAGMEYPTLFATWPGDFPGGFRFGEETTIHELAHQYFYGIIGSDEVEEAWLDEGLTETFSTWAMERLYGPRCNVIDLFGLCLSVMDIEWLGYRFTRRQAPLATPSYALPPGTYSGLSYNQTAVTLRTLERYLGAPRLSAALRRYAERSRFRHPRAADFVNAVSAGAGEDLRWFFDQALHTTRVADYQILSAQSTPHELAGGLFDCPPAPPPPAAAPLPRDLVEPPTTSDPEVQALLRESQEAACKGKPAGRHLFEPEQEARARAKAAKNSQTYDTDVIVQRRGDFLFPVTIRLTFADGSRRDEQWSRAEQEAAPELRVKRLRAFRGPRLQKAEVDPDGALLLDERRLNNGQLVQADGAPGRRVWLTWQGILQTLLDWVGV